jgi:hypothetical protein
LVPDVKVPNALAVEAGVLDTFDWLDALEDIPVLANGLLDCPPNACVACSLATMSNPPEFPCTPFELYDGPPNGELENDVDGAPNTLEGVLCNPLTDVLFGTIPCVVPNIVVGVWAGAPNGL